VVFFFPIILKSLLALNSPVYAYLPTEGNVNFGYLLNTYKTQVAHANAIDTSQSMLGAGIVATGDLSDRASIEISIAHLTKIFYREAGGSHLSEKARLIEVGIGWRRWSFEHVNFGLKLGSGYPFGDYRVVHRDSGLDPGIGTTAREVSHYNGELSVQFEVWSKQRSSFFIDLYYSHGLSAKTGEDASHAGATLTYKSLVREK
jgi:hypothetical protein